MPTTRPGWGAPDLSIIAICFAALLASGGPMMAATDAASPRHAISLNGPWQFQRDQAAANEWKTVPVPSTFHEHEGNEFHGVGWYFDLAPSVIPELGCLDQIDPALLLWDTP